jgi:hypothetical protein
MDSHIALRAAAAATLATLAAAGPAAASTPIASFSLTPSTTQAGAHPDLVQDIRFGAIGSDDPRDVKVSLAAGLVANPTAAATCTETALQADACPAASQVGSGTVTASLLNLINVDVPARLYLVAPRAGEAGRIGMIADSLAGKAVVQGTVALRTTPDTGLDISFVDLPRQINGTDVAISAIRLTFNGSVNGSAFTRNPTSCAPATTSVSVTSYDDPATTQTATSSFTPTGCATLAYAPKLAASAALDADWRGIALRTTITQGLDEAATRASVLTLPWWWTPRLSRFNTACSNADPATCPQTATVGSATVDSPLSATPLSGRVVLVSRAGQSLPGIAIVFPAPFALRIDGTTALAGGGLQTTIDKLPDLPVSKLVVDFAGGPDSLIAPNPKQCYWPSDATATFAGHNGATATSTARIAVSGCPFGG